MTLDVIRERMAEFLRQAGLDAVCAWPGTARGRRSTAVAAVSLRDFQGGPGGFQDYLGERYNRETGGWEELYGKKARVIFGLDLYAPSAAAAQGAVDTLSEALHMGAPDGLRVLELSCGETGYDGEAELYRCTAEVACEVYLYAVADEGGAFLDFEVRGSRTI